MQRVPRRDHLSWLQGHDQNPLDLWTELAQKRLEGTSTQPNARSWIQGGDSLGCIQSGTGRPYLQRTQQRKHVGNEPMVQEASQTAYDLPNPHSREESGQGPLPRYESEPPSSQRPSRQRYPQIPLRAVPNHLGWMSQGQVQEDWWRVSSHG